MAKSPAFKHKNLPEQLADHVVSMIASGEIQPGQRLFEKDVSDILGVSRIPVREAMRILQSNGVLVSEPNRGSFVSEISISETSEILDVRVTIEELALKRLIANKAARERAADALNNCLEELRRAARLGERYSYCKADLAFHSELIVQSESQTLLPLWESISPRVLIFLVQERTTGFDYKVSLDDHERLIEMIKTANQKALSAEIRRHIKGYLPELIKLRSRA